VDGRTAARDRCPRSLRTTLGTQGLLDQAVGSMWSSSVSRWARVSSTRSLRQVPTRTLLLRATLWGGDFLTGAHAGEVTTVAGRSPVERGSFPPPDRGSPHQAAYRTLDRWRPRITQVTALGRLERGLLQTSGVATVVTRKNIRRPWFGGDLRSPWASSGCTVHWCLTGP